MERITSTSIFRYVNEDGEVLLEAPLVDLSHFIGLSMLSLKSEQPNISAIDLAKNQVIQVNAEFGSQLTWGQYVDLASAVQQQMLELKKKNCSPKPASPELTASTPTN